MQLGPFYLNQIPGSSLNITVSDPVSGDAVSLTAYDGVELLIASPAGDQIDTSDGTCSISDAANGVVTYQWPSTTLLEDVGDYRWQLKLTATGIEDLTAPQTFEVLPRVF